jgi:glycosyltransferase involved in cell wall biosynthesis
VSIVTPCYNAEKYIHTTVVSVINQTAFKTGKATLDYLIVDGGSQDKTLKTVMNSIEGHPLKHCVRIISEPDKGMYDALAKGMSHAKGDVFAYINADDYYNITALDIVLSIMEKYPVKWLTGWAVGYNEFGHITELTSPYLFRKNFIAKGVYGTRLPHLQQESTFWRRELHSYINFDTLRNLKYAGDYYIWTEFAKREDLYIVETYLGGFRNREGQLSKQMEKYNAEKFGLLQGKISLFDKMIITKDKVFWRINKFRRFNCVKNESGRYVHFIYDNRIQEWIPLKGYKPKKTW